MKVTIRPTTEEERCEQFPPIVTGGPRIPVEKYVVINPDTNSIFTVFGLPQGGEDREEAVFWAQRLASKNDFEYIAPEGWEDVVGRLP